MTLCWVEIIMYHLPDNERALRVTESTSQLAAHYTLGFKKLVIVILLKLDCWLKIFEQEDDDRRREKGEGGNNK